MTFRISRVPWRLERRRGAAFHFCTNVLDRMMARCGLRMRPSVPSSPQSLVRLGSWTKARDGSPGDLGEPKASAGAHAGNWISGLTTIQAARGTSARAGAPYQRVRIEENHVDPGCETNKCSPGSGSTSPPVGSAGAVR